MSIMSIYQSNLYTVHDAYLTSANNYKFKRYSFFEKILYKKN
jgi:hypothetical protein